jgi:hypothetical protein
VACYLFAMCSVAMSVRNVKITVTSAYATTGGFSVSHIYEESIQFFIQFGEEWFVAITYRSILRGHSCLTDRLIRKAAKIR